MFKIFNILFKKGFYVLILSDIDSLSNFKNRKFEDFVILAKPFWITNIMPVIQNAMQVLVLNRSNGFENAMECLFFDELS